MKKIEEEDVEKRGGSDDDGEGIGDKGDPSLIII